MSVNEKEKKDDGKKRNGRVCIATAGTCYYPSNQLVLHWGSPLMADSDIPYLPPPRTPSYYLVLFFLVLPLWLVIPFSWFSVIYTLYHSRLWHYSWTASLCFAVALCEVRAIPFPPPCCVSTSSSQVFFSIYHYNLVRSISVPPQTGRRDLTELQTGFKRVLKTGLADLVVDEESLDAERPGSPAEQLAQLLPNDPRAIEFRECMRAWYSLTPDPSPSSG